jgi:hypothetical protein
MDSTNESYVSVDPVVVLAVEAGVFSSMSAFSDSLLFDEILQDLPATYPSIA